MTPVMQMQSVRRPKYRTAPRRENTARLQGQFIYYRFLDIAETRLAFPLEVVTDGTAEPLLNDVVGVAKRQLQPSGELPPDGGFTGAGEADEVYQSLAANQMHI